MTQIGTTTPSGWPLGALLADRARDAVRDGSCCLCAWPVLAGQRVARLHGGQWAHTGCVGKLQPRAPR